MNDPLDSDSGSVWELALAVALQSTRMDFKGDPADELIDLKRMARPATDATGTLAGKTITLDAAVPALDGQRVHVVIEPVDDSVQLNHDEQSATWQQWVQHGEDGPITDDAEPEFP